MLLCIFIGRNIREGYLDMVTNICLEEIKNGLNLFNSGEFNIIIVNFY